MFTGILLLVSDELDGDYLGEGVDAVDLDDDLDRAGVDEDSSSFELTLES